ncbi:hypothetical protein EV363DRAFT_1123564, partial [Boletus edulis]
RTTLRPAAAAPRARGSKTERRDACASGVGLRDERRALGCQTVVRRSSRLLSVIGTGSASGARAISKPSIV